MEESLFIHNIRDMKVLHTIRETPPNKNGLCALSIDSDHCYLAYPGHSSVGELQIFDALHLVRITQTCLPILCRYIIRNYSGLTSEDIFTLVPLSEKLTENLMQGKSNGLHYLTVS